METETFWRYPAYTHINQHWHEAEIDRTQHRHTSTKKGLNPSHKMGGGSHTQTLQNAIMHDYKAKGMR